MLINKKILLFIGSILLISGVVRFSHNTVDFSTYNKNWNGGEQIKELMSENHTIINLPAWQDIGSFEPQRSALVILGTSGNFSEKDTVIIKNFVGTGGLLILADDFGSGNQLLNKFTNSISFSNLLLTDDMSFWKNVTFPVVTTSIENVSNITMNYPTSLIITDKSVKVLSRTGFFSKTSRGDLKREPAGSTPVIASMPFERGEIVVVADPSIFINSMLQFQGNMKLLPELTNNRKYVIFDETAHTPPISALQYSLRTNPYMQLIFAVIVLSLTVLYVKKEMLSGIFKKQNTSYEIDPHDENNIISDILKRNKWDERKFTGFRKKLKEVK